MDRTTAWGRRWRSEAGATAVEYAFLASLIALAIVVGAASIGTALDTFFNFLGGML